VIRSTKNSKNEKNFFEYGEYGLKIAENLKNIKCCELFFQKTKSYEIGLEKNSIKDCDISENFGFSTRVFDERGSLGFSYSNNVSKKNIEKTISTAVKMMKAGSPNSEFKDIAQPAKSYPNVSGLFDKTTKNLNLEKPFELIEEMIKISSDDKHVITHSGEFSLSYSKYLIFNTNGVEAHSKETAVSLSSSIVVKNQNNNETGNGYHWQVERNYEKLNASEVVLKALEMAKTNLNRITADTMKAPLILTPKGVITLILNSIASATNAEAFQYNRSFLVGKLNQSIGTDLLNIEDNGLINGATGSSSFDAEGVPCQNKKIIDNGTFLTLLHNTYTAGKDDVESTGNAQRNSFYSTPYIGAKNLMFKPGDFSREELFEDIKLGIILDATADSPNLATGDFSGLIMNGNIIRNGEIQESLNETMIGINLLDLFNRIERVSKDYEVYGSRTAAYVKISSVQISGS
jgi:PmbA protein